jgi:hypothetical protein
MMTPPPTLTKQLSDEALLRVGEFDITGEKLLQASAAEIIVVFLPTDGSRIVIELARIVQGMSCP